MITFDDAMRHLLLLPPQASELAHDIDQLHYFVILTTFGASFFVFLVAGLFFIFYTRKSENQTTPRWVAPRWVEAAYVLGPLALFLLWFFMGFGRYMRLETPPPDAMDVYVVAKQWMWKFTYSEGPNAAGVLHVPLGTPVRLLLTSRDVIHSFFVPAFRIKKDAVPGRYTETWFKAWKVGRYPILCAEYCGLLHSQMLGEVVVMQPQEFADWMHQQRQGLALRRDASEAPGPLNPAAAPGQPTSPFQRAPSSLEAAVRPGAGDLRSEGEQVAAREGCLKCHSVDGSAGVGPTWLGLYRRREPLADGSTVIADEAYLTESMMEPDARVVEGFKPVMPSYQGRLSAPDVAALLEYIKSLRPKRPGAWGEGGAAP